MKKTLIALAALGVVGAASAQVTVSGEIAWGYQSVKNKVITATSQGWGVNTSKITFSASEDLGGGLTASASASIDNMVEGSVVPDGKGVTLGLSGGFGSLGFSTVESGDFMLADEVATVANGSVNDRITFTFPKLVDGFTFGVTYADGKVTTGDNSATDLPSANSSQTGNTSITYAAGYKSGAIGANLVSVRPGPGAVSAESVMLWDVSYDFGPAAIRYAAATAKIKSSNTALCAGATSGSCPSSEIRVTAPLGAATVTYAAVSEKGASETAARKASVFEVAYALSKRTSAVLTMQAHKTGASNTTPGHENTFKLSHKF